MDGLELRMEHPIQMDDLGVPPFLTSICQAKDTNL